MDAQVQDGDSETQDVKAHPDATEAPKGLGASSLGCHFPRHHQQSHQMVQEHENTGDLGTQGAKVQGGSTHKEYFSAKCALLNPLPHPCPLLNRDFWHPQEDLIAGSSSDSGTGLR